MTRGWEKEFPKKFRVRLTPITVVAGENSPLAGNFLRLNAPNRLGNFGNRCPAAIMEFDCLATRVSLGPVLGSANEDIAAQIGVYAGLSAFCYY